VADTLKANPGVAILIKGHTSSSGGAEHNLKLSERRAESVKKYLVGAGIDAEHLSTKGYGSSQPIAPNSTKEGREQNRRVEIQVLDATTCVSPAAGDKVDDKGCVAH
jgi:outer membrane protein OmpA-like peptidoglycan-associated protein